MTATPVERDLQAALALARRGEHDAALRALDALTRAHPAHLPAWLLRAALLGEHGRHGDARAVLATAETHCGATAAIEALRASLLLADGRAAKAAAAAEAALQLAPDVPGPRATLGFALAAQGRWPEAARAFEAVLQRDPAQRAARVALVRCCLHLGDADRALAVASDPGVLDAPAGLAQVLGDFDAAGAWSQQATLLQRRLQRAPHDADAAIALASVAHRLGRPGEALACCERALALRPDARLPREIRATALVDRGDVEVGLAQYRDLLAGGDAETSARHLVLMHYDPAQDNARLHEAIVTHVARHVPAFGPQFLATGTPAPERPLRIGWLSPRFAGGPVASFLPGLLRAFDRTSFRHILVALQPADHDASWPSLADEWVALPGLDDAALLQRLRALDLDVLVDLAGHATANRAPVVAQRIAPVQLAWLDWFDTTGLAAMDAFVSDAWLTPPDSGQRYREQLQRLPGGRFCYTPPTDAPPPTHAGGDGVLFASFNRLAKLNEAVVAAWAAILHAVDGARLELGARLLGDADTREHIATRFARHGIARERLGLHGQRSYGELLSAYRAVDIALDPFPFSGCTTTCDALFMGCAVVTLPGATFVSRQSASLLWRLGRDAWVADGRDDYVARAVALAADVTTLRGDRAALRAATLQQLGDAATHAREFAALMRALWREECARTR